jgi:hypothetical protein
MDNEKIIGLAILLGIVFFAWTRQARASQAPSAAFSPLAPTEPWFTSTPEPWITPIDVPMPWSTPLDQPAPATPAAFDFENPIPPLPTR